MIVVVATHLRALRKVQSRESLALGSLHKTTSGIACEELSEKFSLKASYGEVSGGRTICIVRSSYASIAVALLHDNAENQTSINTEIGSGAVHTSASHDGVPDVANIIVVVAGIEHGLLVVVEKSIKVQPA